MPKFSKQTATNVKEMGPVTDRPMQLGNLTASITTFHADIDGTPMMKGLPDDRCQCAHWGYVLKGKVTFRYAKGEEVFEAGDAFYTPPGHIPVKHEPGTELFLLSPAEDLHKTNEVMQRNMQAMMAGKR